MSLKEAYRRRLAELDAALEAAQGTEAIMAILRAEEARLIRPSPGSRLLLTGCCSSNGGKSSSRPSSATFKDATGNS